MLVKTGEKYPNGDVDLLCSVCLQKCARVSRLEAQNLSLLPEPVLCFECDQLETDTVHPALVPSSEKECIVVLGENREPKAVINFSANGTHLVATGLSSSPYLLKTGEKGGWGIKDSDQC